jgi:hypothetical protein
MTKYRVVARCLSFECYDVEAQSKEEAQGIVERGEANIDADEPDEWSIESVKEIEQ